MYIIPKERKWNEEKKSYEMLQRGLYDNISHFTKLSFEEKKNELEKNKV